MNPSVVELDEFKNHVRMWMEVDKSLKQLQALQKERRAFKTQLTEKIIAFMATHNIDDLATSTGRLVYVQRMVRTRLSTKTIRDRIEEVFGREVPDKDATLLTGCIFSQPRTANNALVLRIPRTTLQFAREQ